MTGNDRQKKDVLLSMAALLLFSLGVMLLPGAKIGGLFIRNDEQSARYLGNALVRFLGFAVACVAAYRMGLKPFCKFSLCALLLGLPFAAVVVGNFPLCGVYSGAVTLHANAGRTVCFLLFCVAVGLFEETVFRAILLPLCCTLFASRRQCGFFGALLSSAIFGLCHLVNLLSSPAGAVFMQIGYSFLVGGMCAVLYLLTENVGVCALVHALFDVGGLLAEGLGDGMVWTGGDVALSAVTAVLCGAYAIWLLLAKIRTDAENFYRHGEKNDAAA